MGPTVVVVWIWLPHPRFHLVASCRGHQVKPPGRGEGRSTRRVCPIGLSDSPVSGTASPCWRCPCRRAVHPRPRTWSAERPW